MFELLFLEAVYNAEYVKAFAYLGAGLAVIGGLGTGLGQGIAAGHAAAAVGKQPEQSGKITITMIVGQAMAETSAIYAFIVALILIAA